MARTQAVIEELERPEEGEKPAESTEGQEPRTPKLSNIGFFEEISRFSNVDWEQHIVYCYRLSPITDRTVGGTLKYVQKYGSRFDQDTLKSDHGSGRYRLQLNRYGEKGSSKTIRTFEIDIEDMNFPPKVPPGEWLDDPRNKRWAWAKAKIQPEAGSNGAESWTPERVMRLVKDLRPEVKDEGQLNITKAVLDAVKETRAELGAANNPEGMLKMLKELILITKPAEQPKQEGESQTFTLLMRMLDAAEKRADLAFQEAKEERRRGEEDRKRAHELELAERKHQHDLELERLKQKSEAASPVAMVKEVLQLQKEVAALGGADERNWKEKLVDEGLQYVPDIIGLGKQALTRYQSRPATAQNQPRPQQQPPGTTVQPTHENPPQHTAQPGADTNMPEPQPPADPEIAFLLPIMMNHGHNFVTAFKNDPVNGGPELAASLILFGGLGTYERIARMGQAKIIETIKLTGTDGAMYKDLMAVGTPEMLAEFIDGFIAGPDNDEDEEDPPIPEAKPRKKKEPVS